MSFFLALLEHTQKIECPPYMELLFMYGVVFHHFHTISDAATSPMLLEPSWALNLEICDSVRQKDVP